MEILNIPLGEGHIVQGDTIPEIFFEFDADDAIDLSLTGVEIRMQIYNQSNKILDLSTNKGITILTPKRFKIDKITKEKNNLPHGTFIGDLEITQSNGDRFTFFRVKYTIDKQYTK